MVHGANLQPKCISISQMPKSNLFANIKGNFYQIRKGSIRGDIQKVVFAQMNAMILVAPLKALRGWKDGEWISLKYKTVLDHRVFRFKHEDK